MWEGRGRGGGRLVGRGEVRGIGGSTAVGACCTGLKNQGPRICGGGEGRGEGREGTLWAREREGKTRGSAQQQEHAIQGLGIGVWESVGEGRSGPEEEGCKPGRLAVGACCMLHRPDKQVWGNLWSSKLCRGHSPMPIHAFVPFQHALPSTTAPPHCCHTSTPVFAVSQHAPALHCQLQQPQHEAKSRLVPRKCPRLRGGT